MDIIKVREECLKFEDAYECFPFDEMSPVYKIKLKNKDKMFAIISIERPFLISLKCEPEFAVQLQEKYEYIIPGYHLNKKHWITVYIEEIEVELLIDLINQSYKLVKLKK